MASRYVAGKGYLIGGHYIKKNYNKWGDGNCKCGCGGKTTLFRKRYHAFISGHQARGKNNSLFGKKHALKTKIWMSLIKKNQPNTWWIGRKHSRLSRLLMSVKRRGKRNWQWGIPLTEKQKESLRVGFAKWRAKSLVLPTKPERMVQEELTRRGIQFKTEELIANKFCVDIFIPKINLIIFVDGCYWHGCQTHRPGSKRPYRDKSIQKYLETCGYEVKRIWEHDILANVRLAVRKALCT